MARNLNIKARRASYGRYYVSDDLGSAGYHARWGMTEEQPHDAIDGRQSAYAGDHFRGSAIQPYAANVDEIRCKSAWLFMANLPCELRRLHEVHHW